jgi:hypothetical protein
MFTSPDSGATSKQTVKCSHGQKPPPSELGCPWRDPPLSPGIPVLVLMTSALSIALRPCVCLMSLLAISSMRTGTYLRIFLPPGARHTVTSHVLTELREPGQLPPRDMETMSQVHQSLFQSVFHLRAVEEGGKQI